MSYVTLKHIILQRAKATKTRSESVPGIDGEEGIEDHSSDRMSQVMTDTSGFMLSDEPVEPKPVDISSIKAAVVDKMLLCLRPPGEPKLKISLKESDKTEDDSRDLRCVKLKIPFLQYISLS